MISIIVPVYNVERYLRQCLNSIIAQTYENWECILVDDGSKDGSGIICDEYAQKDNRFSVIHKENEGVSKARNIALDCAKGDYIAFIDSDDFVLPDFVAVLEKHMKDVDLLMFSHQNFYNDGGVTTFQRKDKLLCDKSHVEQYILDLKTNSQNWEFFGYIWNKCYKKEVLDKYRIRFLEGLSFREDNIFNEAYYRKTEKMRVLSNVLYFYRYSTSGLTYKRVLQKDYLAIARGLETETNDISYSPLHIFDKNRILDFYLNASFPSFFTSFMLFREIRSYIAKYPDLRSSIKRNLCFKKNILYGIFFYSIFYVIPYFKKEFIRFLKEKV